MFSRHVTRNISAYCHGEVSAEEAREFTAHIMACTKCRTRFEEIKLGIKFAEQLPQLSAPDHLWLDLEPRLGMIPSPQSTPARLFTRWQTQVAAIAAVLLLAAIVGVWCVRRDQKPVDVKAQSWSVQRIKGTPRINSNGVVGSGELAVGQWLETDGNSQAQIAVSSIGQVEIDPNTRVRLVETQPTEHRLELARGKMSARIWAPPRLFFVDTPSAVAADLGCAYTLEVDEQGASLLRVTSGWVALELKERESMVPAGAACQTRPGIGPGTPYFEDAVPEFRHALVKIDFDNDPEVKKVALKELLDYARPLDTLTLWHLLVRVDTTGRDKLYDKIATFVPPPAGVTREGVLKLDQKMLDLWRAELEPTWNRYTFPKQVAETYWRMKNGVHRRADNLQRKMFRW